MSSYKNDIVAAIATPPGAGALAVIRISGKNISKLFAELLNRDELVPRMATLVHIYHPENKTRLDQSVVTYFKTPFSFTGEDVLEISCHGGDYIPRSIMSALMSIGVREAKPGEFSFRAFMNGKLDLIQAESIASLINSRSEIGISGNLSNLSGKLSRTITSIKTQLMNILSTIEHELDFRDGEITFTQNENILQRLTQLLEYIENLLNSTILVDSIYSGYRVVLLGCPNVGKSSIYNSLLGRERAIVSHVPGTTRDTIETWFEVEGLPVCLVDTAGYWESDNYLDTLGVDKTLDELNSADIVIFVDDKDPIAQFEKLSSPITDRPVLKIKTKEDLYPTIQHSTQVIYTSVVNGQGFNKLLTQLSTTIRVNNSWRESESNYLVSSRQKNLLIRAKTLLEEIINIVREGGGGLDIVSSLMRDLSNILGELTGEITNNDILENIFSTFCVGK